MGGAPHLGCDRIRKETEEDYHSYHNFREANGGRILNRVLLKAEGRTPGLSG